MLPAPVRLRAALGGFLTFFVAMVALHLLNWGALPRHMSNYFFLRGGWLWTVSILAITVGLGCLATLLRELAPRDRDVRLGTALLWGAGVTFLVLAVFPTDPTDWPTTFGGYMHVFAAIASITLQAAAMLVLVDAGRRDPTLGAVTGRSFVWPGTTMAVGYLWGFSDGLDWSFSPLVQRAMSILIVTWLVVVTVRLQAILAGQPVSVAGDAAEA